MQGNGSQSDLSSYKQPKNNAQRNVSIKFLLEKIVIIDLIIVLGDLPLDLGLINPGDEILHVPGYVEGWVLDGLRTDSYMALFDKRHGLSKGL